MTNTWAVAKRELRGYFTTPVGYVILGAFAALSGLFFARSFIAYAEITASPADFGHDAVPDLEEWMVSPYLVLCGQLIMFIGPLVTMRLLAEERNRGTMEFLLTYPLRDREIVFGKYLAGVCMVGLMVSLLVAHMALVAVYSDVEPLVLVFGLFTVLLMGAAFTSMGLFVSALSSNQVTAGVLTFVLWLTSWFIGSLAKSMPEVLALPQGMPPAVTKAAAFIYDLFRGLLTELPLDAHAQDMAEGVIRPHDVAYYVLFIAFFLFLTLRAFESRKWRA